MFAVAWKEAEVRALWDEMWKGDIMLIQKQDSKKTSTRCLRKCHILYVKRVIAERQLSKALKLVLFNRLINTSLEVVAKMFAAHPQNPRIVIYLGNLELLFALLIEIITHATITFLSQLSILSGSDTRRLV